MIVDYLKNKHLYQYEDKKIRYILDRLEDLDFSKVSEDKVFIDDDIFYMINEVITKLPSEGFWESHKKYIDLHYIIKGSELIGYENIKCLSVDKVYDQDKDLITYFGEIKNYVELKEGMFMILFPEDAHMPNIASNSIPKYLKKVVFKIRTN